MPTTSMPIHACKIFSSKTSGFGKYGRLISIAEAIIKALSMVPMPGTCFKGIHAIRIVILTKKVARPIEILYLREIPCAKTVQGLTPEPLAIIIASPTPKRKSPNININKVPNFGFKFKGFFSLQLTEGTFLIVNTLEIKFMLLKKYYFKSH